jgi:hypothetical protein
MHRAGIIQRAIIRGTGVQHGLEVFLCIARISDTGTSCCRQQVSANILRVTLSRSATGRTDAHHMRAVGASARKVKSCQ